MKRTTRARLWHAADRLARYVDPIGALLFGAGLAVLIIWRF